LDLSFYWFCAAAFLLASHCAPPSREAAPPGNAPPLSSGALPQRTPTSLASGGLTSPPGAAFPWQYFYNRNALLASRAVGPYRVALTEAGHLLIFDREQHLVNELLSRTAASCLGPASPTDVLVGYDDGTIERVGVPDLTRQVVNEGPARVEWIGASSGSTGPIAVFAGAQGKRPPPLAQIHYTVRVLNSGVDTLVLPASAFLLDAKGQLWLGSNNGHMGGMLQRLEPESGRVSRLETPRGSGVYGLAQVGHEVWAYGGTIHLGTMEAEISRVWPGPPKLLYGNQTFAVSQPVDLKRRPTLPIRNLVSRGDRVLVFAFNDLFESDRKLADWKWRARPVMPPVRPDAEQGDLDIRAVDFEDERMILATSFDGLVEHTKGRSVSHALPGQLPVAPRTALGSRDGLLVLSGAGRDRFVALGGGGWTPAQSLLPPPPTTDAGWQASLWCFMGFFRNPDGSIGVIARPGLPRPGVGCANENNDILLSAASNAGRFEERHRELTALDPARAFALPDGTPAVWSRDNVLWTLEAGGFRPLGSADLLSEPLNLGRHGQGWLVLDRGHVMQLEFSASRELRLQQVGDLHGGFDAVRLSEHELVFVDQWGVWRFELKTQRRTPFVAHPVPDRIDALEVDQRGRLWALGEQLYLLEEPGAATVLELPFARPLPPDHWSHQRSLSVSGAHIFVPLFNRGLLVLDADAAASR
jgi:hypothetical protein